MPRTLAQHWSVFLGLALGAVLLPVAREEWVSWRSEIRIAAEQGTPVVRATATIVYRYSDAVVLRVTGEKLRDCKLVGTQAFSISSMVMTIARMERLGVIPLEQAPIPVGAFDMGLIRVWPVGEQADEVALYALHTCGPEQIAVRSTLARVKLPCLPEDLKSPAECRTPPGPRHDAK